MNEQNLKETEQKDTAIPEPIQEKLLTDTEKLSPPKKKIGNGCIVAAVLSIAGICGFLILGAIIVLIVAIIGGASSLSSIPSFSSLSHQNDGLVEKFISGKTGSSNKIALINIKGIIISSDGNFWEAANSEFISRQISRATHDPSIKAILLFLDTPGGEVTAADNIYEKVLQARDHDKVVVSYMNSMAASGGYYIAVASDYIVAHRLCLTGSIGVIMQAYNYHGLFEKIGVHTETYKSGKMKDMLDGSRLRTEEEKQLADEIVMQIYNEFVKIVALGRDNLTADQIKNSEIGDGRVFLGAKAYELGMVDENGSFEDALDATLEITKISEDNYQIVSYEKLFTFSQMFAQMENKNTKVSIDVNGIKTWANLVEPGKAYLLPSN